MTEFINLLQNVAFPAAMCLVLLNMLNNEKNKNLEQSLSFIQAVNNNTQAIERIVDLMEDYSKIREEFENEKNSHERN